MGSFSSKPAPPPSPLLDKPWREINWGDRSSLQYLNDYQLQRDQQLRILIYGQLGAGKSSFINSVASVLKGRITTLAPMAKLSDDCQTKQYTTYRIPKHEDTTYPFVLSDTIGLNVNRRSRKIHVKDVKRLLKAHIKDKYTFNPNCKISKSDRFYREDPTINDKVHVLVYVIDANTVSLMNDKIVETIQDVRDEANELGIPQVFLFTKIDEVCPEIQSDVRNVYKSKKLKEKMENFSALVGVPDNCMFAVQNYTSTDLHNDTDILILKTLRHIIDYGDDFLKKLVDEEEGG